ncbi:MAG TPA: FKBP-type peptidyl-prolyl cis-trans isomerase [Kofleriaceae bacterium]|nr:FKBP-type peptidyl-prolyl cis-trans isomerase [Kofleriaceae bacterium]
MRRAIFVSGLGLGLALVLAVPACQSKGKASKRDAGVTVEVKPKAPEALRAPQIKPPLPVDKPPADAEQITGVEGGPRAVIYIKRLAPGTGEHPHKNDTVSLNFTGWRTTGETFLTTTVRKRPVQQSLARLAPGFSAAVVTMKKGERAMMWIPPELGYMGAPQSTPEVTIYEVELVDIEPGPTTPPDVAAPPADAKKTTQGVAYTRVKPGTGKDKPRFHDFVQMNYSAWTATGRLVDSTVVTKQPKQTFMFRETPAFEEVLRTMTVGEVVRIWMPEHLIEMMPPMAKGTLCYELELIALKQTPAPPRPPPDVAAPPASAKKTAKGVFYKELKPGTGTAHPAPTDKVRVHYTGWTTDGRIFDSSIVRGEPTALQVDRALPGWTEALPLMVVGQKMRFWIPVELAFDNQPGQPKGMLVFDMEMIEILPPTPTPAQKTP